MLRSANQKWRNIGGYSTTSENRTLTYRELQTSYIPNNGSTEGGKTPDFLHCQARKKTENTNALDNISEKSTTPLDDNNIMVPIIMKMNKNKFPTTNMNDMIGYEVIRKKNKITKSIKIDFMDNNECHEHGDKVTNDINTGVNITGDTTTRHTDEPLHEFNGMKKHTPILYMRDKQKFDDDGNDKTKLPKIETKREKNARNNQPAKIRNPTQTGEISDIMISNLIMKDE